MLPVVLTDRLLIAASAVSYLLLPPSTANCARAFLFWLRRSIYTPHGSQNYYVVRGKRNDQFGLVFNNRTIAGFVVLYLFGGQLLNTAGVDCVIFLKLMTAKLSLFLINPPPLFIFQETP
jgi:hypothetical protein